MSTANLNINTKDNKTSREIIESALKRLANDQVEIIVESKVFHEGEIIDVKGKHNMSFTFSNEGQIVDMIIRSDVFAFLNDFNDECKELSRIYHEGDVR